MFGSARYLRSILPSFFNGTKVIQNAEELLLKLQWSSALLAGAFVFGCATAPSEAERSQPVPESHQSDSEIVKRVQVSGSQLKAIFSGATVYGRFLRNDVTWVEHYEQNGPYFVQFSEPVAGEYGNKMRSTSGWWAIRGVLLCFDVRFFEALCYEVYRNGNSFQIVEPTSGETVSVTTKLILADGAVIE
jgi:hypothetical protein